MENSIKIFYNTNSILPKIYQQVEYIESTGAQWINTCISDSSGYKVICDMSWESGALFGACNSGEGVYKSDFLTAEFDPNYLTPSIRGHYSTRIPFNKNQKYQMEFNSFLNYFELDGTRYSGINAGVSLPVGYPIYIFGNSNWPLSSPTAWSLGKGRLYSFKMFYQNDELSRYYIPCYRKYDTKPGLYDIITGKFYINQGDGDDFILGPKA